MTPKKVQKAFLVLLLAFLLLTPALSLLRLSETQAEVQYYEQRNPAPLPVPTVSSLLDGSFFTDFESAVTDRLATRTAAIRSYFSLNMALGRPVVDDSVVNAEVMLGENSYARWDNSSLYTEAEEITPESALVADLGLSSFDLVSIVAEFEEEFDFEVPDRDITGFLTIRDILTYIEEHS